MKKILKKILKIILIPFIIKDYLKYKNVDLEKRFSVSFHDFYPQVKDKTIQTSFDRHYIYHTAWAVRKVKEINPSKHIDISSILYFCTTLSAFIDVDFYDYRPANLTLPGLRSLKADLHALPFENNSILSLSCMHTIEHIGLGRYGDPIDSMGDVKAINELNRVMASNGSLLFVTPLGEPKIEFNAHRIYSYEQIISYFPDFILKEFSLIPENEDKGGLIINANPNLVKDEKYACGCFWFIKK